MSVEKTNAMTFLDHAGEGTDPLRFVARITLEFDSPLLVGSGEETKESDQLLVRDIHGLPLLPGTSIAGVLAHGLRANDAQPNLDILRHLIFGFAQTQAMDGDPEEPYGSRLKISDGYYHDGSDKPVAQKHGIVDGDGTDPVVEIGRTGLRRDRVRINGRGTADGSGKFDAVHCPAGARFTFELELGWGASRASEDATAKDFEQGWQVWNHLLALFNHPITRFGSYTRSGLGVFRISRLETGSFWMAAKTNSKWVKPEALGGKPLLGFDQYLSMPVALSSEAKSLSPLQPEEDKAQTIKILLKDLKPEDTWLFGGLNSESEADITPLLEPKILWDNTSGNQPGYVSEKPAAILTGTGLKGALAHRTLYHLRRLRGEWLGTKEIKAGKDPDLATLFGDVKPEEQGGANQAGIVFFHDIRVELPKQYNLTHNVIDRFTGGVRRGLLYEEDAVFGGSFENIVIHIDTSREEQTGGPRNRTRQAFKAALEDLCNGWLALGGGTGRGHGSFQATSPFKEKTEELNWFEGGAGDE